MPTRDPRQPLESAYGRGGLPWWAALLIAVCVFVPSTWLLTLPATFSWAATGVMVVAWFVVLIGLGGVLWSTMNSVLCKAYGWWPIPVLFVTQWMFALLAYGLVA